MQTHRYTAAVVGAGRGGNLSLKALAASQRFSLEAVADVRPDALAAAQSQFPGIRTFTSHEAMLQECPTDVVCVSTYPPTHRPIAMDALEAGVRGLLVEKPLGDSAAAGRQIIDAARQRSVPLAVPHGLLVADHSVEILRRVQDGQIGQVRLMEVQSPKWDIINAGIHWLNFFVALTDNEPVATVQAAADTSGRTCRDGMQVETEAVTYVVTRSGIRFVMHTGDQVTTNRPDRKFVMRIVGDCGVIEFWAWQPAYWILNAEFPQGRLFEVTPGPATGHQRHLEALADQMDAAAPDYTVAESSQVALELVEAAYLSARRRCRVTFPLADFVPPSSTDWQLGQPCEDKG